MLPVEAEAADRRLADQHADLSVREVMQPLFLHVGIVRAGNLHRAINGGRECVAFGVQVTRLPTAGGRH